MRIQALSGEHTPAATAPVRTALGSKGPGRPASRIGDGSGGGSAKTEADRGRPPEFADPEQMKEGMELGADACRFNDSGPSTSAEASHSSLHDARVFDVDACIQALLDWLNNDGHQEFEQPMTEESRELILGIAADGVSVTSCNSDELPAMRTPWGERACRAEAVAAWCVDDPSSSWKLENWRAELQKFDGQQENLLICSAAVPSSERWRRHCGEKRTAETADMTQASVRNMTHIFVCRFSLVPQALLGNNDSGPAGGQYYVISCPPNVLPMRLATIASGSGQPPWRLEHKQVLPLPE